MESLNRLPEFHVRLQLFELFTKFSKVHFLGTCRGYRHYSEPVQVKTRKQAFTGTEKHATALQSLRWKPYERWQSDTGSSGSLGTSLPPSSMPPSGGLLYLILSLLYTCLYKNKELEEIGGPKLLTLPHFPKNLQQIQSLTFPRM